MVWAMDLSGSEREGREYVFRGLKRQWRVVVLLSLRLAELG